MNAAQERTEGIGYDDGSYTYELFTKAFDSRDQRRETRIRNLTTAYAAVQRSNSYKIFQREWRESSSAGSVIFSNPGCSYHESVRSAEVIRKQHLSMVKRTTIVRLVN